MNNKQIVIASLFGTALGAAPDAPCTNMVVAALQQSLKNDKKSGLEDITEGLKLKAAAALLAEQADEKDFNAKAKAAYTDYKLAVKQVLADYDLANKAKVANDKTIADQGTIIGDLTTSIGDAGKGLTKAATDAFNGWDAVNKKITAQLAINAQIAAATKLHAEEQQILEEPLIKAKASTGAKRVLAAVAAFEYANYTKLVEGDGAAAAPDIKSGATKLYAAAGVDQKKFDSTTLVPLLLAVKDKDAAIVKAFYDKKKDFDKATDIYNAFVEGCKGKAAPANDACKTLKNEAMGAIAAGSQSDYALTGLTTKAAAATAASTGDSTYVTTKGSYNGAIKALEVQEAAKVYATQWEAALKQVEIDYKAELGKLKVKDTDAKKAVTDDEKLELPLQTAVDNVKKYIIQFGKDAARGAKDLAALQAELTPLTTTKIIADDALAKEKAKKVAAEAAKKVASDRKAQKDSTGLDTDGSTDDPTNFATLQTEAKETYDRVKKKLDFYEAGMTVAGKRAAALVLATKAADGLVSANAASIKATKAQLATAIAECKTAEYLRAQNNKNKKDEKTKADKLEYDKIKGPYAEKVAASQRTAAPESEGAEGAKKNVANTLCAYPAKKDGSQPPRPQCAEGLCCGAAQRFMKDGTKMAIETCQKKDAHQYTYYPTLPATATVAPTAQTWRFQCISGAQKLVAAATAALAASYMMA